MNKSDFVDTLKQYRIGLQQVAKKCQSVPGRQVQAKALLSEIESVSTFWFDQIEPLLRSDYKISNEVLDAFRSSFGNLLELISMRPSKSIVNSIFESILDSFTRVIIVPVQKHQAVVAAFPSFDKLLSSVNGLEADYLGEAINCARTSKPRAAIVLGWCAAIHRCQLYVQKEGFTKFNQASAQMSAIQSGRYKRFNKRFDVQNLSDLRMTVFDGDLMWVLEFLGAIDANEHERLEICFTMRNTSAHPGDAVITDENVLSFFSDLDRLVFSNPKFT